MSVAARKTDNDHQSPALRLLDTAPGLELSTKSKILKSAIGVFSKYGFNGTSLRQITDKAGLNHGSIRYHFSNKEALWRECISVLYAQLRIVHRIDDDAWDALDRRQKMEHLARRYMRFSAKNPELFRMIMFETLQEGPRHDWVIETYIKPYMQKSLAQITRGKRDKVFPEDIDEMNIYYIISSANRAIFLQSVEAKRVFGVDIFSDEQIQKHEDAVIKLLFN